MVKLPRTEEHERVGVGARVLVASGVVDLPCWVCLVPLDYIDIVGRCCPHRFTSLVFCQLLLLLAALLAVLLAVQVST